MLLAFAHAAGVCPCCWRLPMLPALYHIKALKSIGPALYHIKAIVNNFTLHHFKALKRLLSI
jgi:hypothetical protein